MKSSPENAGISLLVRKIRQGKEVEASCAELHKIFFRKIFNFFQRRGFSPDAAHDLTQDVFFRVFRRMDTLREEERFETWLFRVAKNIWKNELRRLSAEKRDGDVQSLDAATQGDNSEGRKIEPVAPEPGALDVLQKRERQRRLLAALRKLPPQMRRVCELRYVQQLKYDEIAVLLDISIETVKAHLHQARKRLIKDLGPKDPAG